MPPALAATATHMPVWRVLLLCLIPALIIALILLVVRAARARYGDQPADLTPDPQPQPQRHPRRLASHHSRTRMETETGAIAPLTGRAKGWVPVGDTDPRRFHADGGGQS
jgi:hypothetical protein